MFCAFTWIYSYIELKCFVVEEQKKASPDEIQNIENTLNMVTREQKEVLLKMIQMFVTMLENKLNEYKKEEIQDPMSQLWFWWAHGFFKEIGRTV